VLSSVESVLAVVSTDLLWDLVGGGPSAAAEGVGDAAFEPVLEHLKETTFTSYDSEQMVYSSREIEDRARRVGAAIHAGFQRVSVMDGQRTIYSDLASRGVDAEEIADAWFVVFDGDGDDDQKTALLAEDRATDEFYGAWTYDPGIVDTVTAYLERTYGSVTTRASSES